MPLAFGHALATEDWTSSGAGKTLAESLGMGSNRGNGSPRFFAARKQLVRMVFTRGSPDYVRTIKYMPLIKDPY